MKDSFLLDFPSLSSLTITSKNEPIFLKEQTYSSSTIVTSNIEKKHFKKRSIVQQFKVFLVNIKQNQQNKHRYHHPRLLSHYGELQRRQIGTGASATVRLTHQIQDTGKMRVYAIKAFRKRKARETESSFMKKLISEFCISSTLDHINVVKTVDLVVDDKNRYCTVMEYCSGGDLYSFIKDGRLTSQDETNGYFKQLLNGLSYLHSLGVAHRDIKPENLLLVKQKNGSTTLKISDFGEADVFREAWQETSRLSDGLCGSTPYIAPEIFSCSRQGYRASQSDVWSAAIVYFSMRLNGVPFYSAQLSDSNYRLYQRHYIKASYPAFQAFDDESRSMIYAMLNPDPEKRFTIQDVLKLTWLAEIKPPSYLL